MPAVSRWRRTVAIGVAIAVAVIGLGAQPASAAVEGNKAYNGYAHDLKIYNALGVLDSGPVSAAGIGCSDRAPLFYSVGLADVSLGGVQLGTSTTTSQGSKSGTVQTVTSTFQATGLVMPLLLGLDLRADAITVKSTVTYDTSNQTFTNSSSMNVTNLTVRNGLLPPVISVNGIVGPDTAAIDIPNVATIGLHATEAFGGNAAGLMGKMNTGISVQLLGSTVSVAIGETWAALYGEPDETWLFGAGEGASVRTTDDLLTAGPLVTAQVPCAGGDPVQSTVASVALPGDLGSLGAVTSTGEGTHSGLNGVAETSSEVAGVNLVNGLVTADVVSSTSRAESTDGGQTVSKSGTTSTFANLNVAGIPVSADTPLNTVIQLPAGLGYVVVNGRTTFQAGVETLPLVVHLNPVGVTPAIDIVVARSFAFVLGPNTSDAAAAKVSALMSDDARQSIISEELVNGELGKSGNVPKGLAKGWDKEKPAKDGNHKK